MKILLLLIVAVTISSGQPTFRSRDNQPGYILPTYRPQHDKPNYILPTYRPQLDGGPKYILPTYRPQPTPYRTFRAKRQLVGSAPLFESGPHIFGGKVFGNAQQFPLINAGAGVDYAHQAGHGASLTASRNFNKLQPLPGTNVDLTGTYRLHQSRNGNTLDANAGVSKTFSPLGNSHPQYNAGLIYRFRRDVGEIGGSTTLLENGNHKVSGSVFGTQHRPDGPKPVVTELGAGVNYGHANGHGAGVSASNTWVNHQRVPATRVELGGNYNLHTSRSGNTLDAYGGVSKSYSPFGNSRPHYNAGLRYRF